MYSVQGDFFCKNDVYDYIVVRSIAKPNLDENQLESKTTTSRQTKKCTLRNFKLKQKLP